MAVQVHEAGSEYLNGLKFVSNRVRIQDIHVENQLDRIRRREGITQFLNENEHEWNMLDDMCRTRPWSTNADHRFRYPFRDAVKEMRDAGEKYWAGEDRNKPPPYEQASTRDPDASPCPIITQLRPPKTFPPQQRIMLFTPEFGDVNSYDHEDWYQLPNPDKADVWIICWQGWADFGEMLKEVLTEVLAFADGVSTVWFGHSFGAIVAYECLKECLDHHECPNLPVALLVSGCPAPHLVSQEMCLAEAYPFLTAVVNGNYGKLADADVESMRKDLSMEFEVDDRGTPMLSRVQRFTLAGDTRVMRTYKFSHQDEKNMHIPLVVFRHDDDPVLPEESSTDAWSDYTTEEFRLLSLEDHVDTELLADMSHGFAKHIPQFALDQIVEVMTKYQINKDVDSWSNKSALPDVGDTSGDIPEYTEVLIVGAGIAGSAVTRSYSEAGFEVFVVERNHVIGGIWRFYANIYSRVNTSEVGYRILDRTKEEYGKTVRPNQDHSPTHDILKDVYTVYHKHAYDRIRCGWEMIKVEKQPDDTYVSTFVKVDDRSVQRQIRSKNVQMCIGRRVGKRRDVEWTGVENFHGQVVYGYANEMRNLNFWGKNVLIVGAGAFAFENLRTALENGGKHATILGRRAGTTSPKWIDVIAFFRETGKYAITSPAGNMISFQYWQKAYTNAGLPQPDCWKEGLIKPDNHTVSVSDLAYIGGYHGMVTLAVGEVHSYKKDGQGVNLMDKREMDVDILIKCTGFHINTDIEALTGMNEMIAVQLLDTNLSYHGEPLLDGGQFNSAKGKKVDTLRDAAFARYDKYFGAQPQSRGKALPEEVYELFQPSGNPFGSGYVGPLMTMSDFHAFMATQTEAQKNFVQQAQTNGATVPASHAWISDMAEGEKLIRNSFLYNYWRAQDAAKGELSNTQDASIYEVEAEE